MTLEQLASVVMSSRSQLSRIETAQMMVPRELPALLDVAFGTDGIFGKLYGVAKNEAHPNRYRRRMELESLARSIDCYAGQMVPGLLQTEEYAYALLRVGYPKAKLEKIKELVDARLSRQNVLVGEGAPILSAILDEAVVRRPIGGRAVMRAQLARLAETTHTENCLIQILPYEHGEHALMGGTLNLLELEDGTKLAYEESIGSGQILEDEEKARDRREAYDLLKAYALSPKDSAAFILEVMRGLPT